MADYSDTVSVMPHPRNTIERLMSKTLRDGDCLIWTGHIRADGYGQTSWGGVSAKPYRLIWESENGPVPDGLELDHLCRNRACVNPEHLEPVTSRENSLRGESPAAQNARKTECVNGHPLSGDNVRPHPRGFRICRECRKTFNKQQAARRKAARQETRAHG